MSSNKNYRYIFISTCLLIFLVQYYLFKSYVLREVSWAYPTWADQAQYLASAYRVYNTMLNSSFLDALISEFLRPKPNGSLIEIEGAVSFVLGGPTRLSALSINFIHLIFMQFVTIITFYKLTKSPLISLICIGILMSISAIYIMPGAMYDYRIDFMSFCLYATLILIFLHTDFLSSRKWSIIWGAFCALCIVTRHNTVVYIIGIWIALSFYVGFNFFSSFDTRKIYKKKALCLIFSVIACFVLLFPFALVSYKSFWLYYIHQAQVRGPIRLQGEPIFNFIDFLLYYPKQVLCEKMGMTSVLLLIGIMLLCVIAVSISKKRQFSKKNVVERIQYNNFKNNIFFIGVTIFVPLVVLTVNPAKSSVVGGILAFPVAIMIFYILSHVYCYYLAVWPGYLYRIIFVFVACFTIAVGTIYSFANSCKKSPQSIYKSDTNSLMDYYQTFYKLCVNLNLYNPTVICDYLVDRLEPVILTVTAYENLQIYIHPRQIARTEQILAVNKDALLSAAEKTDFLVLTESDHKGKLYYPYNKLMHEVQHELFAISKEHHMQVGCWTSYGEKVKLFVNKKYSQKICERGLAGVALRSERL
ncbi:membrane hypothetical protein [uncultured Desulfatiglans sp.]|uniref:Glycosyltransferase RgtA/B/C/D-like domain-containing protein n=1 Tax=Uncultured Desulfatiglans sp. TaxID=1748965 RepID=A0A653A1V0_UNCDX|nr:membrane hypothetical protein [uncultured Desulfatiglans sp.]